ncbi:MAG: hypothetical protein A4E56_02948 [Pelotomaculum sp. PtaU1.Bin065]|nr:MAG: hypothetical protein A4E56_02948 [Pelotomaculum sp. PtaU1.Bin065]
MTQKNFDVRRKAKESGVFLWQIADEMGVRDSEFSRMLRKELPPEIKVQVFQIIEKLREEDGLRAAN